MNICHINYSYKYKKENSKTDIAKKYVTLEQKANFLSC